MPYLKRDTRLITVPSRKNAMAPCATALLLRKRQSEEMQFIDKERTFGRRGGIKIVPDRRGESVSVGKAKGFHQNLPQGVQPNSGLIVTQFPELKTHATVDLQRTQVRLDCINCSFNARFEERGDFQPSVSS